MPGRQPPSPLKLVQPMLGYLIGGSDNGTHMLAGDMPHPACPTCGYLTRVDWVDPAYRLKTRYDVSTTWDLYKIVSDRFASFIRPFGARLIELVGAPGFWALTSDEVVEFDADRRRTTFERLCPTCERCYEVIGATPVFLKS